jgi:hypothetical protein
MEAVISELRGKYQGHENALAAFDLFEHEIDFYKRYSDCFGYEFFIMQKC